MKRKRGILILVTLSLILGVANIGSCGFLGIGGKTDTWKEEVLLHDGSKIVVERWQQHGGRHEPGQEPGIKVQSISFTVPGTKQVIAWRDEYDKTLGNNNFDLLALHILHTTPYIITEPYGCFSFNRWGRPNPPYVIFKYVGNVWKRIPLAELPVVFKNINLMIDTINYDERQAIKSGFISSEDVKRLNSDLTQEEYKTIARKPIIKKGPEGCPELIYYKGAWIGPGDSIGRRMMDSMR